MSEENIYQRGCLVFLTTRFWGATSKLDSDQIGSLPDDLVNASIKLLRDDSKLTAVRSILAEAKRFVDSNTMYFPIPGAKFINKNRISFVNDGLLSRKEWALEAVEDLIGSLAAAELDFKRYVEEKDRPDLYDPGNYPTGDQLRKAFKFGWGFRTLAPPSKEMGILSPEVYEQEMRTFKAEMKEFQDSLVSAVAKEFYERIDKLREQCIGTGEINAGTVKSVSRVLQKFDEVWEGCVAHDALKLMIQDVKDYMEGTDASMLKSDPEFRQMVGNKMKEVTTLITLSEDERLTRSLDL